MSVIIRLQGLPWSASAMNIRHFFSGLSIPAGGVHIIGGDGGDAFIAFSSDDDARVAMKKNLCPLNGTPVQLFLSSKAEMQSVIDAARSGGSSATATPVLNAGSLNIPQAPASQQPRQFNNLAGAYPVDNQNNSNLSAQQQLSGFNADVGNQFGKNDWPGFSMYGGREDQGAQGQFNLQNQKSAPNENFMGMQGNINARGGFPSAQQPAKISPEPQPQFPDPKAILASIGLGGAPQQNSEMPSMGQLNSMNQKSNMFNDAMGSMQGNMSTNLGVNQSESSSAAPGMLPGLGRGQGNFPGQMMHGLNRGFNNQVPNRFGPGNVPAGRDPINDGTMGRPNVLGDKGPVLPEGIKSMLASEKFNQFLEEHKSKLNLDDRNKEMMQWAGGPQQDLHVTSHQKPFELPGKADPSMLGREGQQFEQFPLRGGSTEKMNRIPGELDSSGPAGQDMPYPGRDGRLLGRFPGDEPAGRFNMDRFPDRAVDRFDSRRPPPDDSMPSTRYPPDDEPEPNSLIDSRPPHMRGRPDEKPFLPEEQKFPARDAGFQPDERFQEGDRKYPPRGFPMDNRFPPDDHRRFGPDDRRFPLGLDGFRFPGDEGRFPPEERMGMHQDRMRPDEFMGRRPGDNPFAPEDVRFREREEELRQREFERSRRGPDDRFMHEGRPGFRDFEPNEGRFFHPDRRFPPERGFRGDVEDFRAPPGFMDDRNEGPSRWDRFGGNREGDDKFPRPGGRAPLLENPDLTAVRRPDRVGGLDSTEVPMDMDQRAGRDMEPMKAHGIDARPGFEGRRPGFEGRGGHGFDGRGGFEGRGGPRFDGRGPGFGMEGPRGLDEGRRPGMGFDEGFRGPGMEGMRGRGMEGMRGRGIDGNRGRGIEGRGGHNEPLPKPGMGIMDENRFDYAHGPLGRGGPMGDDEFGTGDFDNRFPGPPGRGGMFERRGRGDPFMRGRPGHYGRGRGMDMDRRLDEAGHESRFNMDVDARKIGGRPDGPPLRPFPADQNKGPDFNIKPGSGKGLLGDAPPPEVNKDNESKAEPDRKDASHSEASKRDYDHRSRRSNDRDRKSSDRRDRDRDDRRFDDRDRSRYRYERDRRRSRSRDRGSRDKDGRRSRDRPSFRDHDSKTSSPRRQEAKTRYVHIRNLPLTANYKDVRRFLHPIDIPFDGLKVINDDQGQRIGEAYVQFRRLDDASRALRRNGEKANGQVVSVISCTEAEYDKAVDSFVPGRRDTAASIISQDKDKMNLAAKKPAIDDKIRYIIEFKNLPLSVTKQDISQFFRGLVIENNGEASYIEFDASGQATGNGFVEFKNDFDYKKALTLDGSVLGTSTVRVSPGKKEEADELKMKQQEMFQRAALRNLSGSRIVQQSPSGATGRPALMGPRPNTAQQNNPPPQPQTPTSSSRASTPQQDQQNIDTVCVHIQGLPLLATPQDIREFFADCQIAMRGINIAHDGRGKPLGEGFVEFKFKSDFEKAIKKDKTSLGRHIVAVKPIGKKEMLDRLDNARQKGLPLQQSPQQIQTQSPEDVQKGQEQTNQPPEALNPQAGIQTPQNTPGKPATPNAGSLPPGNPAAPGNKPETPATLGSKSIPPGVLNKNWFYVRCQNFPADISIAEILHFFQGFRPIGDSIRLHYSSEGKPTGNAVVGFGSAEEAQRALQCLNLNNCRQNIITLYPA
ncbi:collagen alpha-1(XI) chain-like [Physella acuta]|uniref:collagen alpha-1(XI) chain-like n=1 Tax=Physella acuta TaxID=109671 RepID=UPI0027DE4B49|nr:collagen alpha-1(XI) chain-like [Physella acuta]